MGEKSQKSQKNGRVEDNAKIIFETIDKQTRELKDAIRCSKEIIVKKRKSSDTNTD
jgi:hypothetical protein